MLRVIGLLLLAFVHSKPSSRRRLSYAQLARLTAADGAPNLHFGYSVATSGDNVAVGAYSEDAAGAVYVLRASDGAELAKLTPKDPDAEDGFGASVAIEGSTVVVGAIRAGTSGAVYVFRTDDPADNYGEIKVAPELTGGDPRFGSAVAISGEAQRIAVAADGEDDGRGAVHVYDFDLNFVKTLTAAAAAAHDEFGTSVAIFKGIVVVGQLPRPPTFSSAAPTTTTRSRWRPPTARRASAVPWPSTAISSSSEPPTMTAKREPPTSSARPAAGTRPRQITHTPSSRPPTPRRATSSARPWPSAATPWCSEPSAATDTVATWARLLPHDRRRCHVRRRD